MSHFSQPGATTALEDQVLFRVLGPGGPAVTGFISHDRQEAALALATRGLIKVWWGDGKDRNVLLATRPATGKPGGRGDAA